MSRKAPWFPMYTTDFIAATMAMSSAEVGCYIRLLCYQWTNGGIPDDYEAAKRVAGDMTQPMWKVLRCRFQDVDGVLVHPRLEQERVRMESVSTRRSAAATRLNQRRKERETPQEQLKRIRRDTNG